MIQKTHISRTVTTLLLVFLAAGGGYLAARLLPQAPGDSAVVGLGKAADPGREAPPQAKTDDQHGPAQPKTDHAVPSADDEHGHAEPGPKAAGHGPDDGHGHGAEGSDLERPVAELWAASCEHSMPQYQCDECRYEIGAVKLDAALLGEGGLVRTGFPERRQGRHEERTLPGEVQLDETRTVHVASPLTGLVTRAFTTPGDKVEAGAPLFEVDSPEVAEAKASYLKAVAGLDFARQAASREALLFAKKIAAQVEVQEAEAKRLEAETELSAARGRLLRLGLGLGEVAAVSAQRGSAALHGRVVIRASRAGTVIEGHAAPGEYAETGKELLTISSLDTVWVLADVKEAELALATSTSGQEARVEALGRSFPGRLQTISGRMSEATRTAKARFSVDNREGLLKPGLFVNVRLLLPVPGESLVVPKVAVLADEGRTFVFTHQEGDFWLRRPVSLGKRHESTVEITSGLSVEQRIITDGSFLLKSDVLRGKMGAGCAD